VAEPTKQTHWYLGCEDCCSWVKATACDPNRQADPPDVYVHMDSVPEGITYFRFGYWCYYVNSATSPGAIPQPTGDEIVYKAALTDDSSTFTDCADCVNNSGDPDVIGGSGRGSSSGGGGGGWVGTGSGWGLCSPYRPCFPFPDCILATLCSGYDPPPDVSPVYVVESSIPEGGTVFRWGTLCYEIDDEDPSVGWVDLPDERHVLWLSGYVFDNCAQCQAGKKATVCEGQSHLEGYENLPEVWIPTAYQPTDSGVFTWSGFCWQYDKDASSGTIPYESRILRPQILYETCGDCGIGVRARLCEEQQDTQWAPKVWVRENMLPAKTMFFRISAWCYYLDPTDQKRMIPPDALVVIPHSQYNNCFECVCGEGELYPCGVRAYPCVNLWSQSTIELFKIDQDPANIRNNLWVRCRDAPPDRHLFFMVDGICYYVPAYGARTAVEQGGILVSPHRQFQNCLDCVPHGSGRYESDDYPLPPPPDIDDDPDEDPAPPDDDPDSSPGEGGDPTDGPLPDMDVAHYFAAGKCDGTYGGLVVERSESLPATGYAFRYNCECYRLQSYLGTQTPDFSRIIDPDDIDATFSKCGDETNPDGGGCIYYAGDCATCVSHTSDITAHIYSECDNGDCTSEAEHEVQMSSTTGCTWTGDWPYAGKGDATISLHKSNDQWRLQIVWDEGTGSPCPGDDQYTQPVYVVLDENGYPECGAEGEEIEIYGANCRFYVWIEGPTLP